MKKQRLFISLVAGILAVVLLLSLFTAAFAASSSDIKKEIDALKAQRETTKAQKQALQAELDANWESIEESAAYKNSLDQQVFLLYEEITLLNELISSYSTLIAQTQAELEDAEARLEELNAKYKERIRAMEEAGTMSYWTVIFKSNSFTDLIDRLNMIQEIVEADKRMMDELEAVAAEVAAAKEQLIAEKEALEESRVELDAAQAELQAKSAEVDQVLAELYAEHQELTALHSHASDEDAELIAQIAKSEKEYNEALAKEEAARKAAEEARKKAEEEAAKKQNGGNSSGKNPNSSGWLMPCAYSYISSSYGQRSSGWHNGTDFAASRGTPIYATRSGTVTVAKSLQTSYGNYVTINHGDGYSSLYAHMDYYVVSVGQYVVQGQLIGYVGSTGNSTGPHLHLTIFYNGSTVNPMSLLG